MSNDFQYDPFAKEGEAFRDPAGVTHIAALVGKGLVECLIGFCGTSLEGSRRAFDDDVDCMTCLVHVARSGQSNASDMFKAFDRQRLRPGVMLMSRETYETLVGDLAGILR